MRSFNAEAVEQSLISVAHELNQAKARVDAHETGPGLRCLVQHARALHDALREQIAAGDPWVVDELRAVSGDMGLSLRRLEILMDGELLEVAVH